MATPTIVLHSKPIAAKLRATKRVGTETKLPVPKRQETKLPVRKRVASETERSETKPVATETSETKRGETKPKKPCGSAEGPPWESSCKIVGQAQAMGAVQEWCRQQTWRRTILVLTGPPGCGKTLLANSVLAECGFRVTSVDASMPRSRAVVSKLLHESGFVDKVAIVLDELERSDEEHNPVWAVQDFAQQQPLPFPVVCISNESLTPLRDVATTVRLRPLDSLAADQLLQTWGCCASRRNDIIQRAAGDVRQLYYEFHMSRLLAGPRVSGGRDGRLDAFQTTRKLLAGAHARGTETWDSFVLGLVQHNYPRGTPRIESMEPFALFADRLGDLDLFVSRFWDEEPDWDLLTLACAVLRRDVQGPWDIEMGCVPDSDAKKKMPLKKKTTKGNGHSSR